MFLDHLGMIGVVPVAPTTNNLNEVLILGSFGGAIFTRTGGGP